MQRSFHSSLPADDGTFLTRLSKKCRNAFSVADGSAPCMPITPLRRRIDHAPGASHGSVATKKSPSAAISYPATSTSTFVTRFISRASSVFIRFVASVSSGPECMQNGRESPRSIVNDSARAAAKAGKNAAAARKTFSLIVLRRPARNGTAFPAISCEIISANGNYQPFYDSGADRLPVS